MNRASFAVPIALLVVLGFGGIAAQAQAPVGREIVTAWDRVIMEAAFTRADVNDDGMLSKAEASRLAALSDQFDALDADRDGVLSLEEFAFGFAAPL
jgi:hypothetical protein